jgi:hypothetical protein
MTVASSRDPVGCPAFVFALFAKDKAGIFIFDESCEVKIPTLPQKTR